MARQYDTPLPGNTMRTEAQPIRIRAGGCANIREETEDSSSEGGQ